MRIASFIDERRTYKNTSLNKGVSLATFSEAKVEGELEVKAAKVVYMHIYICMYIYFTRRPFAICWVALLRNRLCLPQM